MLHRDLPSAIGTWHAARLVYSVAADFLTATLVAGAADLGSLLFVLVLR